ncbi:MAG: nucleotidyltransferase domain-containing protein [Bacteroidales bacterium]|nr:nucleotidyltransferase domain-containing protein [Clostridium sp.]MCM1203113.1 nucleotidyltransferase domain-containing protein [Bacteroidales bacterium]
MRFESRRKTELIEKDIENDVVRGVLEIFQGNIDQIILYGSVVRGEQSMESDIDIALILYSEMKDDEKRLLIDWSAEFDFSHDCVLSIVDIVKEQFEKWNDILPFYRNIRKEGVMLWRAV